MNANDIKAIEYTFWDRAKGHSLSQLQSNYVKE